MGRLAWPLIVAVVVSSYLIVVCLFPFAFVCQEISRLIVPTLLVPLTLYFVVMMGSYKFRKKLPREIDNKNLWLWIHWAFVYSELLLPLPLFIVGAVLVWLIKDAFWSFALVTYFELMYIFSFYVFRAFRNIWGMDYREIENGSLLGASAFALLASRRQWNRRYLLTSFRMADSAMRKIGIDLTYMRQVSSIVESTEYYSLHERTWNSMLGKALLKLPDLEDFAGALQSLKNEMGSQWPLIAEIKKPRDWTRITAIASIIIATVSLIFGKEVVEKGIVNPILELARLQPNLLYILGSIILYLLLAAFFLTSISYWLKAKGAKCERLRS